MYIDTHTHLYSEQFAEDREAMIQRAIAAGVEKFFLPNIDSSSLAGMKELISKYPKQCFPMMGLHPCSVNEKVEEELALVKKELDEAEYLAVGEIGIDLYWDKSTYREQEDAFRLQIRLAKEYKLPIVIHCRNAFDEIFKILNDEKSEDLFGIFHCFTGDLQQARKAISYNMKLGIGGVVTFKNGKIDKFLSKIDLSDIVL